MKKEIIKIIDKVTFWHCIYCKADNVTRTGDIVRGDIFLCASCATEYSAAIEPA